MAGATPAIRVVLAAWTLAAPLCSGARGLGAVDAARSALLQTYNRALDGGGAGAHDTPVTRVVNLLKDMQKTLEKEMSEDEGLYKKLGCWCNTNSYEKDNAISDSEEKVSELGSSIESHTAKSGALKTGIAELTEEYTSDKASLAEATALRGKQAAEFHGAELDSIQAIENLKAALTVLGRHHDTALPQLSLSLLSVRDGDQPHEATHLAHSLEEFMMNHGFDTSAPISLHKGSSQKFLQQGVETTAVSSASSTEWSNEDAAVVKRAVTSASVFMQAHHGEGYYPSYAAQSGEIVGVLKQLKEEMEADLSTAQKRESARAAAFADLRSAKMAEIQNGEKMAENKEDELATTNNELAEFKEDLGQEEASLSESQRFLKNLKATCAEADKNFDERKQVRMTEMKAVADTISILTADEARDAMSGTYSLVQVSSRSRRDSQQRAKAAAALRHAAAKSHSPELSALATTVELDAFTKVKKAIDKMIAQLKVQQKDEVKKTDWCKEALQENEMTTAKTEDRKADLEAKEAELGSTVKTLEEGIADAKAQIASLQLELQRASEDRKTENLEFQKTVADQTVTVEVLKTAMDKLATFYDKQSLVQLGRRSRGSQAPPVPQMEYKPSKGSSGVMEMIEKLIHEAKDLIAGSQKSESEAQAAYETLIADTNGSVAALAEEVAAKSKAKAGASKEKLQTQSDITGTVGELDGLSKYNGELHAECDYVLKNFGARQEARAQEIEALQQAKQILSGASLG